MFTKWMRMWMQSDCLCFLTVERRGGAIRHTNVSQCFILKLVLNVCECLIKGVEHFTCTHVDKIGMQSDCLCILTVEQRGGASLTSWAGEAGWLQPIGTLRSPTSSPSSPPRSSSWSSRPTSSRSSPSPPRSSSPSPISIIFLSRTNLLFSSPQTNNNNKNILVRFLVILIKFVVKNVVVLIIMIWLTSWAGNQLADLRSVCGGRQQHHAHPVLCGGHYNIPFWPHSSELSVLWSSL